MISAGALIAIIVCVLAVIVELPTQRIPNWLCLPGVVGGLILGVVDGDLFGHAAGLLVLGVIALGLFAAGWAAGGTAKLLMAVGSLAGLGGGLSATGAVIVTYGVLWVTYRVLPPPDLEPGTRPREPEGILPSSPLILVALLLWTFAMRGGP